MDWLDLLAVQETLESLLQHHSSKASILWHSAFFIVQLSHLSMTTGNTMALTRWTFVSKVMSLLFNMLSRFVTAFLPRSKHLLISWLQSPSAMILVQKIKMSAQVGSSIQQVLPVGFQNYLDTFYQKFRVEGDRKHFTCLKTTSYKGETLSPHCCGGLFSPITLPVSHLAEKCQ